MQIERAIIPLQTRTHWQAVEAGFALARANFLPLFGLALLPTLLFAATLFGVTYSMDSRRDFWLSWWMWGMWWLKPVTEQAMIAWLGRAMFGTFEPRTVVIRHWLSRSLVGIVGNLTWRRLSPIRGLNQVVQMLEGLHGSARGARLTVLARSGHNAALVTCLFFVLHYLWLMAVVTLIHFILPDASGMGMTEFLELMRLRTSLEQLNWTVMLACVLVTSVVTPFFVAAMFMLYLNARIRLEAWDLAMAARAMRQRWQVAQQEGQRLAQRKALHAHGQANFLPLVEVPVPPEASGPTPDGLPDVIKDAAHGVMVLLCTLSLVGFAIWGTPVLAQPSSTPANSPLQKQQIKEIMQDIDTFGGERTVKKRTWEFNREQSKSEDQTHSEPTKQSSPNFWLNDLALVLKVVAWLLLVGVIGAVLLQIFKRVGWIGGKTIKSATESVLPQTWLPPNEQLPERIVVQAEQTLERGQARAALADLYRATLAFYADKRGLEIGESATEGEAWCLLEAHISAHDRQLLQPLWQMWQSVAYQHAEIEVTKVQTIIAAWRTHYGHV